MKSFLLCTLLMSIIFAQTTARLDKEDRSNIKRILRGTLGKEAYPYDSEDDGGHEGETEPVSKIDWHDGEDPIRKIMRAVYGENEYPAQRVNAESQDGGKREEEKPQPEQIPDTRPIAKFKSEEEKAKLKQKPVTSPATKFDRTNQPAPQQTSTTSASPSISYSVKSSSRSGQNLPATPGNQYTLPDNSINKQVIDNFKNRVDKTWSGTNYGVQFKRDSPQGDTQLWWRKGNDSVYLHKYATGAVRQEWNFGVRWPKVNIELLKGMDGNQRQTWNFLNSKFNYKKNYWMPKPFTRTWTNDKKDESSLKKYAEAIQSWCNANDFFVGKEYCVIFFTTRID
ncbi:hypothetical protein U1Q18_046439 [Sarracenia purpurea var. burkii]